MKVAVRGGIMEHVGVVVRLEDEHVVVCWTQSKEWPDELECQIAPNCDPPFRVQEHDPCDGAETGGAELQIAEQSRSWRAAIGERRLCAVLEAPTLVAGLDKGASLALNALANNVN